MTDAIAKNRYPALSIIVIVVKAAAIFILVLGLAFSVLLVQTGVATVAAILGTAVGGVVTGILLWAAAESIAVIIDIEANTRASALALLRAQPPALFERMEPTLRN